MNKTLYVIERVLLAFITAFIIISICFLMVKLMPENKPVGNMETVLSYYNKQVNLGYYEVLDHPLPDTQAIFQYQDDSITYYYYVRPIMSQYASWLRNVFTKWDWGYSVSIQQGIDVFVLIGERLPTTIIINAITIALSIPAGIGLGILAAVKKNKATDRVISVGVMVFISIPSFVFLTLLVMLFGYVLDWLPTIWPTTAAPTSEKFLGYIIPVLSGFFGGVCGYERLVRGELTEAMASDYLLLARTKGLTKFQSITRHALRNAMVPVLPSILANIISVLSGSAILEQIYGIPGIGQLFVRAINSRDYNVLMADMTVFTLIGLLSGIILDLSYGFLDPRIRMGERK